MTGLENLKARTMLVDNVGDFWYYDGTGGMYCMVEGGVSSRLTTEFAARWAPFTQLMAADWGNALTVAIDERDAAERELVDCKIKLTRVYAVLTRINSDIERCVRCGSEPEDGDLFKDKEGDTWLFDRGVYELLTVAGMRAQPGVKHPDEEMTDYKPLIKLVPENKT